jgi:hypothetical protein
VTTVVSEETLEKVREAFHNVRREHGLNRWDLDDKVVSPFLHESNSDRLAVSLVRDDAERTSISLDIKSLIQQEGAVTVIGLEEEIEMALHKKNFMA